MKRYINRLLKSSLILTSLILATSCEDYLERTSDAEFSDGIAFRNFTNFQGFTEELYECVPNFTNRYWTNSWNWGEDEIMSTAQNFHFIAKVDNGDFWGWQAEFDGWGAGWMDNNGHSTNPGRFNDGLWPGAWLGIRKANLGLANLDLLTEATAEERDLIEGQLLFFRGWFHFQLMAYFGGLPYIDELLPADEPLRLPRLNYHETADKAAADLRRAADLLPINWDDTQAGRATLGNNEMRINKIMALGYLGKNLLWAGSPLMNEESTGNKSYNTEYCRAAADAFGELLELVESGQTQYELVPFEEYSDLFWTSGQNWQLPGSTESLFRAPYSDAHGSTYGTARQFLTKNVSGGDDTQFMPTANYVMRYYGMANGLPLPDDVTQADPASGYDPEYPWRNRDPRFYHDIVYDGVQVVEGSMGDQEQYRYANLYTGGNYRLGGSGSRSGFLNRKFIPLTSNSFDGGYNYGANLHIQVPYMRLADIYLMYAEAALMGYGVNQTASNSSLTPVDAINVLRDRAGVGQVDAQFTGSVEAFLPEVRRERAVELAFERHRFNDLRRWYLLAENPYTLKTSLEFDRPAAGMPIVVDTDDPSQNQVLNLSEEVILERNFGQRHYWLPLKIADVNIYPEFNQNPGW